MTFHWVAEAVITETVPQDRSRPNWLALRGLRIVIVDDGSSTAIRSEDFAGAHTDIEILRHAQSKGPAAARNTGLAACKTGYVAFLDSDVVPRRGWLEALLGHFCDPTVALAALPIAPLDPSGDSPLIDLLRRLGLITLGQFASEIADPQDSDATLFRRDCKPHQSAAPHATKHRDTLPQVSERTAAPAAAYV